MSTSPSRALICVLLVSLLPVTGCIGGSGSGSGAPNADGSPTTGNATPTDGTSASPGDAKHVHDRWDGKEELVLVDETITTRTRTDVDPGDGAVSAARDVVFGPDEVHFRPRDGEIVPPGTDKVTVSASWPDEQAPQASRQAELFYRSAADAEMQETDYQTTPANWTIDTELKMADGGHAEGSVWAFRLELRTVPDAPTGPVPATEGGLDVQVQVVAHRVDGPLPKEAPHPDWYANGSRLEIHSGSGSAEAVGAWFWQWGTDGTWFPAADVVDGTEHTIVPSSTRLLVAELNWSDGSPTADAAGATPDLQWNNGRFFEWNDWGADTTEAGRAVYTLPIEPGMTDGIYPGTSRWRFRYGFFGQDTGVDEPVLSSDLRAPFHFDGSWTFTVTAYDSAEGPAAPPG